MSEFTRQLTGRYAVTRSPESRAPIACEPLPPQPVTPSLKLACELASKHAGLVLLDTLEHDLNGLEEECEAELAPVALPVWGREEVKNWRQEYKARAAQERGALVAAQAALDPAPLTARGVVRGLFRAITAIPQIIVQEARRG